MNKLSDELHRVIKIYKTNLIKNLSDSIENKVLSSLSNMLAIYYIENNQLKHEENSKINVERISFYLGKKIIVSYDFGVVLELFAVAISDNKKIIDNVYEVPEIKKNNDIICSHLLSEITNPDITLKELTLEIIESPQFGEISDYIYKNNKKYIEVIEKISLKNQTQSQKLKEIIHNLQNLNKNNDLNKEIKNTFSLLGTIVAGASIAVASSIMLGVVAPLAILPATALGSKIASNIIEKLAFPAFDKIMQKKIEIIHPEPQKAQIKNIEQTKQISEELKKEAQKLLYGKVKPARPIKKEHTKEIVTAAENIKKKVYREI